MKFRPPIGLRSPHSQSMITSSVLRKKVVSARATPLLEVEQEWMMDAGHGRRLIGHYCAHPGGGLDTVVLLHGWEGSSSSNYMLATGTRLFNAGFNVFRLNFRDHGQSHHLNPGIFHSCRLDEVVHALGDMQDRTGARSWLMAGFSLGGNFALRAALAGPASGLSIGQVFSVCPVINPANVLKAMESGPTFYETHFIRKWARSLRAKQACFPDRYDYDEWHELGGLRERTEYFATQYYDFESLDAYLDGYSIAGDRLKNLSVRATILAAADDPVVPVSDARSLPRIPNMRVKMTARGGHCGYLVNWKLDSWAEELITKRFLDHQRPESSDLSEQVA